ncbi:hypothetical protein [Nostocoides sp. F2B08]|uniref:hypothetical protein n=1 Tax=Nostocoides sp. F2B08 TaxID=2653936 RepID=UPI00186AD20E|nr:hypothetical protein [Tetrasphaera sp. F2B08]
MAPSARPPLNPTFLLAPAGLSLLVGINAGLLLGDLPAPMTRADLAARHGILMVLGFLGTLIALERAVALRAPWGYAGPALLGAGALTLAFGGPQPLGAILLVDGCVVAAAVYSALFTRQHDEATAVGAFGAVAALIGALLWLRVEVYDLVPWLVAFVVLTITSERVELARLHRPPGSERILLILGVFVFMAAGTTVLAPAYGVRLFGFAVLVLTLWTAVGDVARHTIRTTGLPRFAAAAMLVGYVWLVAAALVWILGGPPSSRAAYDVVVHAVFLGFAMSMVLAHAPVILPAVVHRPLPYHPVMWALLLLLQVGLVLRLVLGAGLGSLPMYRMGLWLTAAALLLLPVLAATLVLTAARREAGLDRSRLTRTKEPARP